MTKNYFFRGILHKAIELTPNDDRLNYQPIERTFGYLSIEYRTSTSPWTPLSRDLDKFTVTAPTLTEARSEFWSRWSLYLHARFGIRFGNIQEIN